MDRLKTTKFALFRAADLPLEVVILIVGGLALSTAGGLLFLVAKGALPFYENGLYGLLIIIFALQMIMLGKTPFGDLRKSKYLLILGVMIAAIGMITCFIPILNLIPRLILFICFGPGGFLLLLKMCLARDKLWAWVKYGGIFRHLIFSCSLVYVLSMLIAILFYKKNLVTASTTAVVIIIFGLTIFYLAGVLIVIYRNYPQAAEHNRGEVELNADHAILLLMGILMLLLGGLLFPVSLGRLPFSGSAQLGLLMVIFAINMLASGNTPLGPFPRTWLTIGCGLLFAALGIISCIIPQILVSPLTILVGVLNISGGVIGLIKMVGPRLKRTNEQRPVPAILKKLFRAQLVMNLLGILFGSSMLIPGLIPGSIIGAILAANGGVLLYLLHILILLDKLAGQTKEAA